MSLIEVAGLRKVFRTRRGPVEAVAGIDFRVEAGEFVGYAGPNGAGKSTTVKMMSGILLPSGGRVEVCGMVPYRERKRLARRMGVVFGQRTQLWWDLPLEESFELVGHLYRIPRADRAARLRRLEEVLALGPLLGVPVRSLSLGQRMRAELAAAVLPAPEVLFLDEPTIGLDVEAKAAVRDFLRELKRSEGTTVILTTHDLDDITRLCSRLLIIDTTAGASTTAPWRRSGPPTAPHGCSWSTSPTTSRPRSPGPCSPGPRDGGAGSSSPATRSARPS
ncbi:MAG TPA: ATP-binding cassette domain-containing protein [Actinomycetes bacterium]|nr:ATP-binding cassette domain-containing protein [Actinomycetes bacterium]